MEDYPKFSVTQNTILVYGGLDKTKAIESIAPNDSSFLYVDQQSMNLNELVNTSGIWHNPNIMDMVMQSSVNKIVIEPFLYVNRATPSETWSKGSALDPWEADWHKYLVSRGIVNWQFDYNKGIAFTWANGALKDESLIGDEYLIMQSDFENNSLEGWKIALSPDNEVYKIGIEDNQGEHFLRVDLPELKTGGGIIRSPLIPAEIGDHFSWKLSIKGYDLSEVDAWIAEYGEDGNWISSRYVEEIGKGSFGWNEVAIDASPEHRDTKFISLDIAPLPNPSSNGSGSNTTAIFWMDNVKVYDSKYFLESNLLELPFTLKQTDEYDLYVRYFKNRYGGRISVDVDDNSSQTVNTYDEINEFVWQKIGIFSLSKGSHRLTISNDNGFNGVNLFVLVPHNEIIDFERYVEQISENKKAVYIFEPATDMYQNIEGSQKVDKSEDGLLNMEINSEVWRNVQIMEPGNYSVSIRANGDFKLEIDDRVFWLNFSKLQWLDNEPLYLERGIHKIRITAVSPSDIDTLCIWSNENNEAKIGEMFNSGGTPAAVITRYQMNDATKYVVNINATKPFMLSFNEKYDPLWRAMVNGEIIESKPLDSIINGFWINQTGQLTIVVEYEPQEWFYYGSIMSAITLIIIGMFMVFVIARREKF